MLLHSLNFHNNFTKIGFEVMCEVSDCWKKAIKGVSHSLAADKIANCKYVCEDHLTYGQVNEELLAKMQEHEAKRNYQS